MPIPPLARLDINKPEDVQVLLDRGLAWRSGPKTLQKIFRMIQEGAVTRRPDREPPEIRAFLDKVSPVSAPSEPRDGFTDVSVGDPNEDAAQ